MIKLIPRNIARFVILILLQIWVLNNIQLSGYINPYMYILFILLLPFETPNWALLLLSFLLGISIDLFAHNPTVGIHASACVFMGFLRPYVLRLFSPRDGYEPGTYPRMFYYGFSWFFKYAGILVLAHHIVLFYIEVFKFDDFAGTLLRVVLSAVFSLSLIIISQFLIYRK